MQPAPEPGTRASLVAAYSLVYLMGPRLVAEATLQAGAQWAPLYLASQVSWTMTFFKQVDDGEPHS